MTGELVLFPCLDLLTIVFFFLSVGQLSVIFPLFQSCSFFSDLWSVSVGSLIMYHLLSFA